jgi:hypothetical protein
MIHTADCWLCTWKSFWGGAESAINAEQWHVYTKHRAVWPRITGSEEAPRSPAPPLRELTEVV